MLIIFGVRLQKQKKIVYALPQLYGIGISLSKKICCELNFAPELTIRQLTGKQQFEIAKKIKEKAHGLVGMDPHPASQEKIVQ